MSSLRSSGRASCVPLANRPSPLPLLAHHAHDHVVHVTSGEPDVLAHPALLHEPASRVGPDGALVRRMGLQPHAPEVPDPERVIEEQVYGLAPVATPPVILLADADAELAVTGRLIEVEETAIADGRPVDLHHEVGLGAGTLALLPFEPGSHPFEGCGQRRIATPGQFDLQIVPEPPEGLLVLLLNGPQRNSFSPKHQPSDPRGCFIHTFGSM